MIHSYTPSGTSDTMGKLKEIPLHCMTITADLIHLLLSKYTVNFITFHFSEIKHTYEKKKIHIFIPLKTKAEDTNH